MLHACITFCISGLTESLFANHKDEYPEYEQASLRQLYKVKVCNCFNFPSFQVRIGFENLYTNRWNADGRIACWKPDFWFIWDWDNWTFKGSYGSFFSAANICHCSNRVCTLEWRSNLKMQSLFLPGNFFLDWNLVRHCFFFWRILCNIVVLLEYGVYGFLPSWFCLIGLEVWPPGCKKHYIWSLLSSALSFYQFWFFF